MKINNKRVYYMWYHHRLKLNDPNGMWYHNSQNCTYLFRDIPKDKFIAAVNKVRVKTLLQSVLYFSKTSGFPRFKLDKSNFSRCIKLNKADCVVIKGVFDSYLYRNTANIFIEDDTAIYEITNYNLNELTKSTNQKVTATNIVSILENWGLFFGKNPKIIYSKPYVECSMGLVDDIVNIIDGNYKKVIFDTDLDIMVNKSLEAITEAELKSITELLDSPDKNTRSVGMKMLFGYDVSRYPLTVRTTIALRSQLQYQPEWNSTGFKQVLRTINFNNFSTLERPYNIIIDGEKYSDEDKQLCRNLYTAAIKKDLKS